MSRTAYIRWYGSVVQGEVVENQATGSILDGMVAVRIPLMGMHAVALFWPQHVYGTAEAAGEEQPQRRSAGHDGPARREEATSLAHDSHPGASERWLRVQAYKREHWDEGRNCLKVDALDDFYQMWREGVAAKMAERKAGRATLKEERRGTTETVPLEIHRTREQKPEIHPQKAKEIIQLSLFEL